MKANSEGDQFFFTTSEILKIVFIMHRRAMKKFKFTWLESPEQSSINEWIAADNAAGVMLLRTTVATKPGNRKILCKINIVVSVFTA